MATRNFKWDYAAYEEFTHSTTGELGDLMSRLGDVVLAGARRRAKKRTGRMIAQMRREVENSEIDSVYCDVHSPVRNEHNHFNYAIVHEDRKCRDRRPQRSLVPALQDIRKILVR